MTNMHPLDDTIVALASAAGGAARGIVRLTGPDTVATIATMFASDDATDVASVEAPIVLSGTCRLPSLASVLPCSLYLWPRRRSYTGQPVAEVHTIGSPPLLDMLVKACCSLGARLAEPGEFTLRAFLAGRIDLTQAEAVLGAIDATDSTELSVALSQLAGGLAKPLTKLRDQLLDLLSHLEAGFDFADEDLEFITPEEIDRQLEEASKVVERLTQQTTSRGTAGETVRVVLAGCPNTGKSSLFNALVHGQPVTDGAKSSSIGAIVSHRPGTTRDYLVANLDLNGVPCRLIDTAGIEETYAADSAHNVDTPEAVWNEARELAIRQHRRAHVRLFCLDATRPLVAWERHELDSSAGVHTIVVLTKCDLPRKTDYREHALSTSTVGTDVSTTGLDRLRSVIREAVLEVAASGSDVVAGTAVRCHESLRLASESLARARQNAASHAGEELVAAEIRVALEEIGKVAGVVYTDDVLDRIFSRFCVGK